MSETLALIRLALARHRWLLTGLVIAVSLGATVALIATAGLSEADREPGIAVFALFWTLFPSAIAVIGLFDYGDNGDMSLPESGCSHWLLRMPIASWKIALVPVILKTLWITCLWALFVFTARRLGIRELIPLVAPSICFSAIAIWVLIIAWRPFRSGWRRLVSLAVAGPIMYCCIGGVLVAPHIKQTQWRSFASGAAMLGSILVYLAGTWLVIRTVELARTSSHGIIPERGSEGVEDLRGDLPTRSFRTAGSALIWHDRLRAREWIRRTLIIGVLPAILLSAAFLPFRGSTLVMVLLLFAYLAGFAISRSGVVGEAVPGMPPYLAASPLSTRKIAWLRGLAPLVTAACVYSCVLFVFAGWALSAENRHVWMRWATDQATSLGHSELAVVVGVRWSIAIFIAVMAFVLGRLAAYIWVGLTGRTWVHAVVSIFAALAFLIPMGFVLRWFMQQTDWELMKASALDYLSYAPMLIAGLLVGKGLATLLSSLALKRLQIASSRTIVFAVAVWGAVVALISITLFVLIPDPRATMPWCLALTAVTIPLARILLQPLALDWNRHR